MKVQIYWNHIIHYTAEMEVPFDDPKSKEAQDYIENKLPLENAKEIGTSVEVDFYKTLDVPYWYFD